MRQINLVLFVVVAEVVLTAPAQLINDTNSIYLINKMKRS
jgi:hypothetical protein